MIIFLVSCNFLFLTSLPAGRQGLQAPIYCIRMQRMRQFLLPFWEVIEVLAVALVSFFLIRTLVVQPFVVNGPSMEPTFYSDQYVLVDEITYKLREPERGEIVVFRNPRNEAEFYIKRIIGLPGETVAITDDVVEINGEKLNESYINVKNGMTGQKNFALKNGEYFVMGDNRPQSFDSRSWGPLDKKEIIGMVRLRFLPFKSLTLFEDPSYKLSS